MSLSKHLNEAAGGMFIEGRREWADLARLAAARLDELEAEVAALRTGVVTLTCDVPPNPKPAPANVLISEGSRRIVGKAWPKKEQA